VTAASALEQHLDEYRALREQLERRILPLASSVDGRTFTFQAPLHALELAPGGYAMLEHGAERRLGQVLAIRVDHVDAAEIGWAGGDGDAAPALRTRLTIRTARGDGVVLAGARTPFHDATVRPATPAEVAAALPDDDRGRARLPVGELLLAPGVPFALDAGGFDRHTFFCGQSGSGKTYSLGVVLEQLLLETELQVVILDPNSDFARLDSPREGVDPEIAARWRAVAETIGMRSGSSGENRLHVRLDELSRDVQAAMLRLDPIADREEYAELGALVSEERPETLEQLMGASRPAARALAQRVSNFGVDRWGVWARGATDTALAALLARASRCLVVDLGSLETRDEQALVAASVLGSLWARRAERQPVLIVIDEAHNVCPSVPGDALTAIATDHAVRIAGEGRKFGLYLLVCTQRPQKVHENVVSQCDNLVLMRMASAGDLAYIGDVLSFAPGALLAGATGFRLGEALVAGKLASHPALVRFGRRVAAEGGADVEATWASPAGSASA
jgi:DNA helicase HerA-like ATPase